MQAATQVRRVHLSGTCIPDAYISLCKNTTQGTRVQKMPASTPMCASKRCTHRPLHTRVERYARRPPMRAYKEARATSYARLRDTRVGLFLRAPNMAAPTWTRAKDARVAPCCLRRKDTRV